MSYFISFPKIKEKVQFFRRISLGPSNHIVPNLTLLTVDLIWVKFILSCLLYKNLNPKNLKHVNEIILNPRFGSYNRVLTWSFEYASRNVDPPQGILIARKWNYGKKARENNRDFFDFMEFGRFIKDILDTENPAKFLRHAKKYAEGNLSEVPKDFLFWEERFRKNVIGVNLSGFDVKGFLRKVFAQLKRNHFEERRKEFITLFIFHFLQEFREKTKIEKSGIINDHPIFHYVKFITNELGITRKEDLLNKIGKDEKSLQVVFQKPESLEPKLSDQGVDAFLILKLLKDNAVKHFYSFVILTYLKKRNIDFRFDYLDIYRKLETEDFRNHIKHLEKTLSKFGSGFCPFKLNKKLLKFLAIWWEYYQFAFVGEKIAREIHGYLLDNLAKDEIRKKIRNKDLEILRRFLENFTSSGQDYYEALKKDIDGEQILLQLEEIVTNTELNAIFNYLYERALSSNFPESVSNPFFPSLDSFERWVDELGTKLQIL